ncbi:hypothetical protein [Aeromicrobium sp.]|uniref:hypothetical protein n=1 Tax=Aeromicrobium sp. TaxID=1871063 RepID=UPI0019C96860|nr:hypothetical protein [Aeromicrobium sp.]MBC7631261.1 hypothetical protein [Aeromicrobium sp.]
MIAQKPSSIEEAPSLADIKSAGDRVGRVDFTTHLGTEGDVVALTSMVRPSRTLVDSEESNRSLPFILPPAKVDEAMAAEAARARRTIAEARGEVVEAHEPAEDQLDDDEAEGALYGAADSPETIAVDEAGEAPVAEERVPVAPSKRSLRRGKQDPEPQVASTPAPAAHAGAGLMIQDVASLDEMAAEAAAVHAAEVAAAERAEIVAAGERAESEAAAAAEARALARLGASVDLGHGASVEDVDDLDIADTRQHTRAAHPVTTEVAVEQDVADVAASVIALMRSTADSHQRHLESVELEAARRCELLTAQAELDAELIRLHARREAHAIISASGVRTSAQQPGPVGTDHLSEIGETFSRFAETIETIIAFGPASHEHPRKS